MEFVERSPTSTPASRPRSILANTIISLAELQAMKSPTSILLDHSTDQMLIDPLSIDCTSPPYCPIPSNNSGYNNSAKDPSLLPEDLLEALKAHSIFALAAHDETFIQSVAASMRCKFYAPATSIVKADDVGTAMYFILKGIVNVTSDRIDSCLAELHPGSFFGEIALLFRVPRTANVIAKTKCMVACLSAQDFERVSHKYPEIAAQITQLAKKRYLATATGLQQTMLNQITEQPKINEISIYNTLKDILPQEIAQHLASMLMSPQDSSLKSLTPNELFFFPESHALMHHPPLYYVHSGKLALFDSFHRPLQNFSSGQFFTAPISYAMGNPLGDMKNNVMNVCANGFLKACEPTQLFVVDHTSVAGIMGDARLNELVKPTQAFPPMTMELEQQFSHFSLGETSLSLSSSSPLSVSTSQASMNARDSITSGVAAADSIFATDFTFGNSLIDTQMSDTFSSTSLETADLTSAGMEEMAPSSEPLSPTSPINSFMEFLSDDRKAALVQASGQRRKASVAVWSDPMLSQIANMKAAAAAVAAPIAGAAFTRLIEISKSLLSLNYATLEGKLEEKIIMNVLSFCMPVELIKLSSVSKFFRHLIKNASFLKKISFKEQHKKVSDQILIEIIKFAAGHVVNLDLSECWHISNTGLTQCASMMPHLEELNLLSCWDITTPAISSIAMHCKNLRELDLSNCRKIDDSAIVALASADIPLATLSVAYCKNLTDESIRQIARMAPTLHSLNLQRCTGITDEGFLALQGFQWPMLTSLNLSDCSFLTDSSIQAIAQACPCLSLINLSFCCSISELSIQYLALCCKFLTSVDISYCGAATSNAVVELLASRASLLERLSFRGCFRMTPAIFPVLLEKSHSLKLLNASACKNISIQAIEEFKVMTTWIWLEQRSLDSVDVANIRRRFTC